VAAAGSLHGHCSCAAVGRSCNLLQPAAGAPGRLVQWAAALRSAWPRCLGRLCRQPDAQRRPSGMLLMAVTMACPSSFEQCSALRSAAVFAATWTRPHPVMASDKYKHLQTCINCPLDETLFPSSSVVNVCGTGRVHGGGGAGAGEGGGGRRDRQPLGAAAARRDRSQAGMHDATLHACMPQPRLRTADSHCSCRVPSGTHRH
jgi:hypothetical protein